jgi:endo-1,4-beta-mannosidase
MPTRKGSKDRREGRADKPPARATTAAPAKAEAKAARAPKKEATEGKTKMPRRNLLFPLGVNYYPLDAETQSWDDWYANEVDADFDTFAGARLSLVRLFLSWKVLEPQVGQYNEDAIERFEEVIDAARTRKLKVIVTFFADDRLAEMLDVPWGKRRDPRTDQYLIQREVALVQKIVNRFRADAGIFAWDLANEAFMSGFESKQALEAWVETMRDAVREVDAERPIMVSADPETMFRHSGVDPRNGIDTCEILVSHATSPYRAYAAEGPITSGPSTYLDSFLLRAAGSELPVLLDDVGVFSLEFSAAEEVAHLRTVLYSGLMNRGAGALVRRYRDLDTERREPYFRDPFEVLVGVADSEGEPKPAFRELAAFARTVARIDLKDYQLAQERVAVVVPEERYLPLPALSGLYDPRSCLQSYMSAKEAHIPVTVTREREPFEPYSVLLVPSAFSLSDDTWERLSGWVQAGGFLVYSYGGGDAHDSVRDVFGVEFLGDGGRAETLTCRVAQADVLGALRSFDARLEVPNFALLGHGGATIVATDAKGSPLLTVNQLGQGRAAYVAAPVERALAQGDPWSAPSQVREMMREVYGAAARVAGCQSPVGCDDPAVEIALFGGDEGDIVVLLNHAAERRTATLSFDRVVSAITDVRGSAPVEVGGVGFGVPLEANAAVALHVTYG